MTEKELTELRKLLAAMPTPDLNRVKDMARAELDTRHQNKRTIRPVNPWGDFERRGHE
jgi:hypothetical protein